MVNLKLDTISWCGILVISQVIFFFLQSEPRVFTRLAFNCGFLRDLDALAPVGAWSPLPDLSVRLQKFPAMWLRIGGLLYLAELSDLNGRWFRWEGKYFRKIFLGGFTSATRYNCGEEVKRKLNFSFYKTPLSISQTTHKQSSHKQGAHKVRLVPTDA